MDIWRYGDARKAEKHGGTVLTIFYLGEDFHLGYVPRKTRDNALESREKERIVLTTVLDNVEKVERKKKKNRSN